MTIAEYLQNPYGKGSAIAGGGLQKAKEDMMREYTELLPQFALRIYKYRDEAIFHVVVPSRKRPSVSYDVVLEIRLNDIPSTEVTVENTDFKVFSNCPSFIFTYAHAFEERGMIIKWLDNKYKKEVRKNVATTKNAYNMIGMERSLYLACLYLSKTRHTDLSTINTTSNKVNGFSQIALTIRSQDQVMQSVKPKIKPTQDTKTPQPKGSSTGPLDRKTSGESRTDYTKRISKTRDARPTGKTKSAGKISRTKRTKKL